jgi:hypothetical protein
VTGRLLAAGVLLAVLAALLFVLVPRDEAGTTLPPSAEGGAPGGFVPGGPDTCLPCHAQVVAEWRASMHAAAFTDPQVRAPGQADDFRKTECLPCHAPRPLFEHGIEPGARVLARVERRADGVDCLSCHGLPEGSVAAVRSGLDGACRPALREALGTHLACAACHDQHDTHQEWLASPAAAAGLGCADCHMPRVNRSAGEVGAPRAGRSHRFPGGRDAEFAAAGFRVETRLESDSAAPGGPPGRPHARLVVTLVNEFAGHNLPTDSRNRALDLVVTLLDRAGRPLPPPPGEARESWEREGTARRRFRNPYRSAGRPSTQLPAGESAELVVALPPEARTAWVDVLYKLQPFSADDQAHWRERTEVTLPARDA